MRYIRDSFPKLTTIYIGMPSACAGYDYPDDPYILRGSCGLEYELNYAPGYSKTSEKEVIKSRQQAEQASQY
jgi:hypothetical protein